jgi:DNA invertase Pin-like site-specific DNA recombinase
MMATRKQFISYFRVSTDKQGASGLGLEAQKEAVSRYLASRGAGAEQPIAEYTEIESGKRHSNRPQLLAALAHCRKLKATLVIARLDRLARNVHFVSGLMETGVPFVAADMPEATPFMLHIYAAVGEQEALAISQRTKVALAAAKARGTVLGNARWQESISAARSARGLMPPTPAVQDMMRKLRSEGQTLRAIAAHLNQLGLRTPQGSLWYASTVRPHVSTPGRLMVAKVS